MKIIPLPKEDYDYHELHYTYTSPGHYLVEKKETEEGFAFSFRRELLPEPIVHDSYDTLYQEYWQMPEAFGLTDDDGTIVAYLEIEHEEWNNRLRITNLLVAEEQRGRGYGRTLVNYVKAMAEEQEYRVIVLETQSCNLPAIDFYRKCGFGFAGTNLYFYSNDDIAEDEVMIEMTCLL